MNAIAASALIHVIVALEQVNFILNREGLNDGHDCSFWQKCIGERTV